MDTGRFIAVILVFHILACADSCSDRYNATVCADHKTRGSCKTYGPWMTQRCAFTCNLCDKKGKWTPWKPPVNCSCGDMVNRTRTCPTNSCGAGNNSEEILCNKKECADSCAPWGEWSDCDDSCENGTQSRVRCCYVGGNLMCNETTSNKTTDSRPCDCKDSSGDAETVENDDTVNPDLLFCLSFSPALKNLSPAAATMTKMKILQILHDEQMKAAKLPKVGF